MAGKRDRRRRKSRRARLRAARRSSGPKLKTPLVVASFCPETGNSFSYTLTGRYWMVPKKRLEARRDELLYKVEQGGGMSRYGSGFPLHLQVEHLEKIVEFMIDPPCGCPPSLTPEGEAIAS